ncbi:Cyclic pyranopterin monophosphate synthase 2 [Acaryochloris thomasi RCC1774]|uniref:Cyclic pyranopterin monophosphate synthase n=1 Tax=Acaryochloris thomasi RCC1774 TaxID=1764569 RepID=A0A2W1JM99_9CYAN|nr:cyclic pyranopterin monophosphate synthase MoaC [Acaryochloris thomasi]PZD74336.1 Cyclic pyranopterin monophosphate synthase 2 [Acaryochloris thomasi RCC1774]
MTTEFTEGNGGPGFQPPHDDSPTLTHLDVQGQAHMVDVSEKVVTARVAIAQGQVLMSAATFAAIEAGNAPKGDVLGTARLAGIMAAKQTAQLIPLCHPLPLQKIKVEITPDAQRSGYVIQAIVKTKSETGVEMEALTAVSIAALTLYDMAKALEKSIRIENIHLLHKQGGKSGEWHTSKI